MNHCTLFVVGSLKTSWIQEGCEEYARRIGRSCRLDVVKVPAGKQKDPAKQRQEESQAVLDRLAKTEGEIWVLDETGKQYTSAQFADALTVLADRGKSITFVLGGAYGHTEAVLQKADRVLALSAMTLPHELCRLVFLEQLYRAQEIRRGSGYHH